MQWQKQESYLLFDTEPAAYQVKEENDPTVKNSIAILCWDDAQ